jgi:hypothetical protein
MRSLAQPWLTCITPQTPTAARRLIRRKKGHYGGSKPGYMGVVDVKNNPKWPWKA